MDAYCERNWKQEKGNAEEVTLIEHHAVQKATYLCVRNFEGKRETCSFMGREKHYPALQHRGEPTIVNSKTATNSS
jgi:hypothetical protein